MSEAIHKQMVAIMRDCDGITKDQRSQGGFQYRGIDDAYNTLHDILAKHGVFTVPRVTSMVREQHQSKAGNPLQYTIIQVEYDFIAEDGSKVTVGPVPGEAMDSGDKSAAKSLAIAHKYALFQVFMIPTNLSVDPDAEVHEVGPGLIPHQEPQQAPPVLARDDQKKVLNDYARLDAVNKTMASYMLQRGDHLTEKQADQLIDKLDHQSEESK